MVGQLIKLLVSDWMPYLRIRGLWLSVERLCKRPSPNALQVSERLAAIHCSSRLGALLGLPLPSIFITKSTYVTMTMDIDIIDEEMPQIYSSKAAGKRPRVPVDDAHPFELETYISSYSGSLAPASVFLSCIHRKYMLFYVQEEHMSTAFCISCPPARCSRHRPSNSPSVKHKRDETPPYIAASSQHTTGYTQMPRTRSQTGHLSQRSTRSG